MTRTVFCTFQISKLTKILVLLCFSYIAVYFIVRYFNFLNGTFRYSFSLFFCFYKPFLLLVVLILLKLFLFHNFHFVNQIFDFQILITIRRVDQQAYLTTLVHLKPIFHLSLFSFMKTWVIHVF